MAETNYDGFLDGFDADYESEAPEMTETPDASEDTETTEGSYYEDDSDIEETEEETSGEDNGTDALAEDEDGAAEDTTDAAPAEAETISYTYNKQTTALPLASVKAIADKLGVDPQAIVTMLQKGANYDVAQQRTQPYDGLVGRIRRYADMNQMSIEDAIGKTTDALDVIESSAFITDLRAKYPDAPANVINDMALMAAKQAAQTPFVSDKEREAEAHKEETWKSFFANHPDIKGDNLSDRMVEAYHNGEDPEVTYLYEKNQQLQAQITALQQKASVVQRSTGTAKRTSGSVGHDPFAEAYGF